MNIVRLGPEYFPDPNTSRSVANGYLYVGTVDTDPTIPANQKQLSVQQEDGSVVNVNQPVRTNKGGVPTYQGSSVTLLVEGAYSLLVQNSQEAQVYYVPNNTDQDPSDYLSDYGSFAAALLAIGNTPTRLVVDIATNENVTIPSNIHLDWWPSALASGTMTIKGSLVAENYQIFDSGAVITGLRESKPEWRGAKGDGVTDDLAALILADADTTVNGGRLIGTGNYLISGTFTPTSQYCHLNRVKLDSGFTDTEGVVFTYAGNSVVDVDVSLDGNNSAIAGSITGFNIKNTSSPNTHFQLTADNCDTGLLVDANSEKLNVYIGGFTGGILVHQAPDSVTVTQTPDENNYWISGSLYNTWYKNEGNTSARVIFNCESNVGTSDYAVIIRDAKWVSLGGIIRGAYAGGVYIEEDTGTDNIINLDNLCMYLVEGGWGLYAISGRSLTGRVIMNDVADGGAWIQNFDSGVDLDITVNALSGGQDGIRIGDTGNAFRFGRVQVTLIGNSGTGWGINVDNVNGRLDLDMTGCDQTLRTNTITGACHIKASTRMLVGDTQIQILGTNPIIQFVGALVTSTQLAAYSYPENGMHIDGVSDTGNFVPQNVPGYFRDDGWSVARYVVSASGNIPRNGIVFFTAAISVTLQDATVLYQRVLLYNNSANTVTLTVNKHETSSPEVFTFDNQFDRLVLEWTGNEWRTVINVGVTV